MIELLNQFGSPDKKYGWLTERIGRFQWFKIQWDPRRQQVADGVWSGQENYLCEQYGGYKHLLDFGTVYFQYHGDEDPREFETLEELFFPKLDDPRDQYIWYIGQTTGGSYDKWKRKAKSNNHKRMRDHKNYIEQPEKCQTKKETEKYKLAEGKIPTWSGMITAPVGEQNIISWAKLTEQGFISFFQSITGYPPLMNLDQSNKGKINPNSVSNKRVVTLKTMNTLEEWFEG